MLGDVHHADHDDHDYVGFVRYRGLPSHHQRMKFPTFTRCLTSTWHGFAYRRSFNKQRSSQQPVPPHRSSDSTSWSACICAESAGEIIAYIRS